MAKEADHIALANKNHDALMRLMSDPEQFPEWIATIAFYKALQVVEAVFAHQPGMRSCAGHKQRLRVLKIPRFKEVHKHYRPLWAASTVARYLFDQDTNTAYTRFTDFLPAEKVIDKIVKKRLRSVEQNLVSMLSANAQSDLQRIPSD